MSPQTFTAVLIFSLVMAFTPGPNNVMLASSGARFGVVRTLPHIAGVTVGFPVMFFLVGLGLASILLASPMLQLIMKTVSCAYLLWLAFQIARSTSATAEKGGGKPLSFLQGAAFQWINPKAWLAAVGAISGYTSGGGRQLYLQVAIIALITLAVSMASTLTWTAFGAAIRRVLRSAMALRLFNVTMALLLVISTLPILLEIWNELAV
jgi:threonine/homoserine/homoserine lactone efflux protein